MQGRFLKCGGSIRRVVCVCVFTLTRVKDFKASGGGVEGINTISVIKHEDTNINPSPYVLKQCQQSENYVKINK